MKTDAPPPLAAQAITADGKPARATRSFRLQVALVFGTLIAVTAVALSLLGGDILTKQVRQRTELSLAVVAGNVSRTLASELFSGSVEVLKMAGLQALWTNGLGSPEVGQMLALSKATTPYSSWIGVVDTQGVVRAATDGILLGQNVAQRPWYGAGRQGHFVGDVHAAKLLANLLPPSATGEPLRFVDFAAPVVVGGQTVGVLGIHGSIDWLAALIDKLLPANAAKREIEVFVFDRDGALVLGPGGKTTPYVAMGQTVPLRSPADSTQAKISVVRWADSREYLTSQQRVVAQSPVSDLGWQVAVREPVELAFLEVQKATRMALAVGLAVAALGALLAWWLAGRVSRNLSSIVRAARDVEAGKDGAEIPLLSSSDELQSLSTSLNRMTRRLQTANQEMEATVRERTAELQEANFKLGQLAQRDPLTGLLNRRGMDAVFKSALAVAHRSGRPLAVAMVDIDHFKRINDVHGHDVGDTVLVALARLIKKRVRQADVVARFGGEEFVVLLPDTDLDGAEQLGQLLVEAAAAHDHPPYGSVTISVGVAEATGEAADLTELLQRADAAMYRAKHLGRNQVCR